MVQHILTGLFILAMIANAVAFVRHWRMLRVMEIVLSNLAETQREFHEQLYKQDVETLKVQKPANEQERRNQN